VYRGSERSLGRCGRLGSFKKACFHTDTADRRMRRLRKAFVDRARLRISDGYRFPNIYIAAKDLVAPVKECAGTEHTSNKISRGISGRFRSFPLPRGFPCFGSDTTPTVLRRFPGDLVALSAALLSVSPGPLASERVAIEDAAGCFKR
jgi:hypothetical protein